MIVNSFQFKLAAILMVLVGLAACAGSEPTTNTSNQSASNPSQATASKTGIPECDQALEYFAALEKRVSTTLLSRTWEEIRLST